MHVHSPKVFLNNQFGSTSNDDFVNKISESGIVAASNKGDIVFDPFMGSGTTAVVAEALGRKWFGVEKDETYVSLAKNRVKHFVGKKHD